MPVAELERPGSELSGRRLVTPSESERRQELDRLIEDLRRDLAVLQANPLRSGQASYGNAVTRSPTSAKLGGRANHHSPR